LRAFLDGDQLTFANDRLFGDQVDDVRSADATTNRIRQTNFNLLTAINNPASQTLGRTAVVHRDDHVLADVGQLTGQVTAVRRFQAVSARPLRAPCVELKYSSTDKPSRKFDLIGVSMISPLGLAINHAYRPAAESARHRLEHQNAPSGKSG
jgi:hypothetical protein